jgi:hypothetical protein
MQTFTLWRCSACGKWSHAAKRPKYHQRCVFDEPREGTAVISHDAGFPADEYGALSPEVWWVKCGPFETWTATESREQ